MEAVYLLLFPSTRNVKFEMEGSIMPVILYVIQLFQIKSVLPMPAGCLEKISVDSLHSLANLCFIMECTEA